jgi:homoserine dehydrogenase
MHSSPRLLLLGYGNVAKALLPLLDSRGSWLEQELGIRPLISGIGSRRTGFFTHSAGVALSELAKEVNPLQLFSASGHASEDAAAFIRAGRATGANALIELTTMNPDNGEPALGHIRQALEAGMDVITANKGPIAHAGEALQTLARQRGLSLRYESAVMDGLPLVNLAEFTLPAVGMRGFRGLLNCTSSIVLSQVEQGSSLEEAIRSAQEAGVAEADPWHDLDGWDAALKTTILANALLNARLTPRQVQRSGIRDLSRTEVVAAARKGTPIRQVSSAQLVDGVLSASVSPQRLQPDDPLFAGRDLGMISLETEAMGTITLTEHSTGVLQTAYGVLSDLIAIQRARNASQETH